MFAASGNMMGGPPTWLIPKEADLSASFNIQHCITFLPVPAQVFCHIMKEAEENIDTPMATILSQTFFVLLLCDGAFNPAGPYSELLHPPFSKEDFRDFVREGISHCKGKDLVKVIDEEESFWSLLWSKEEIQTWAETFERTCNTWCFTI